MAASTVVPLRFWTDSTASITGGPSGHGASEHKLALQARAWTAPDFVRQGSGTSSQDSSVLLPGGPPPLFDLRIPLARCCLWALKCSVNRTNCPLAADAETSFTARRAPRGKRTPACGFLFDTRCRGGSATTDVISFFSWRNIRHALLGPPPGRHGLGGLVRRTTVDHCFYSTIPA